MIGDPGGRVEERNLLDRETLAHNVARIKRQLERILDFEPGPYQATLVDNADWTAGISLLDFLRDVGKHITVNQMVAKESVRARLEGEHGISYTEFSYMLLQANDFRHLHEHHGVELQMGGSDQWGNITAGIDLIRTTDGHRRPRADLAAPAPQPTAPSSARPTGGAVWLDPERTSPVPVPPVLDPGAGRRDRGVPAAVLDCVRSTSRAGDDRRARAGAGATRRRSGRWRDELTELVHGPEAAAGRRRGRGRAVRRRPGRYVGGGAGGGRPRGALVTGRRAAISATSSSCSCGSASATRRATPGARSRARVPEQRRVIGVDTSLDGATRLHGRYLLLRKRTKSHHLVEVSS